MARARPAATLGSAWVLALALAPTLDAQSVRGRVVSGPADAAVPGALISLLDPAGAVAGVTVSAADGSFRIDAPPGTPYRVTGEAPGYETVVARVGPGDAPSEVVLRTTPHPPDVDLPRRKAETACRIPAEESARIALLWAEAAKALRVVAWTERSGALEWETSTWFRLMEPRRLRVLEESRTPRAGFHPTARPPSPPARRLAAEGYVQGGGPGESLVFHGPDASTLVDPVFAETHCLGFESRGPEEGWVGLTFAPLDREAREVEGTLWIEGASGAPTRLEYRYTTLPWPLKTDKVGGGLELERLEGGGWIVSRWWLRMPRVGLREERVAQWDAPRRRFTLTGLVEEGGAVTRVRSTDGRIQVLSPPEP